MKRILSFILAVALMLSVMVVPAVVSADEAAPAADIIIEVGSEYVKEEGAWDHGSSLMGPTGNPSWYSRKAADISVKFSTEHVAPGEYEVSYWKIVHTDGRNDKNLAIEITHAGGVSETTVNCDEGQNGWVSLGKYTFTEDVEGAGVKAIRAGKDDTICSRVAAVKLTPVKIFTEAEAAGPVVSEGDKYIADLLTYIGVSPIIDLSQPDAQVTRAQFLAAVMKALKAPVVAEAEDFLDVPATHTYYNEIKCARANGIVAGDGNGYFKPDNAISFEEAAKIAIHSFELLSTIENIGVERANAQGGYTVGYILELNKQGLAKGLSADVSSAPLTTESVKTIILNLLNAKVREIVTEDKITVLSRVHDIYETEGKVENVFGASVVPGKLADKGYAFVDGVRYELGDLAINEYLGQEVDYYYVDQDNTDRIIAMRTQPGVEVIEISAEDILNVEFNVGTGNFEIEYYDEDSKVERATVHADTAIYFNNVKIEDAAVADFKPLEGSLKLVGNSSKTHFDYAYINSYENFIVERVNTIDERLYDVYGNTFSLKEDFSEGYELQRNGKVVPLEKLAQWDVLSKPARREGTAMAQVASIEFARKKAEGILESRNKEEIFIDGKAYEFDAAYKAAVDEDPVEAAKFTLGKPVVLYLDINGKVAYAEEGKGLGNTTYAWLNKLAEGKGLDSGVQIEAFLQDGTWDVLQLADDINYTDENGITTKVTAEEFLNDAYASVDIEEEVNAKLEERKEELGLFSKMYQPHKDGDPTNHFTVSSSWDSTGSSLLPSDDTSGKVASIYTNNPSKTATYDFGDIPAGTYEVFVWSLVFDTTPTSDDSTMEVVVNSADGPSEVFYPRAGVTHDQWVSLGEFTFSGYDASEGVTFTPGDVTGQGDPNSTRTICTRVGSIKIEEVFDYETEEAIIRADIMEKLKERPATIEKVVEYRKNSAGLVKEIKILKKGTDSANRPFFTSVSGFVSGNFVVSFVDANTVVFVLPEDLEDKEDYEANNGKMFKNKARFDIVAYDENDELYAPVMIVTPSATASDEDLEFLIVNYVSKSIDPETGDEVATLRAFSGGTEVSYRPSKGFSFDGYTFGDVISISSLDSKGRVTGIKKYTSGESGSTQQGTHIVVGTVTDIASTNIFINKGSATSMYSTKGASVQICDLTEQTITDATVGSISIDDKVVYTSKDYAGSKIIVYKE